MAFAAYRVKRILRRISGQPLRDDFYWEDYNTRYRDEVARNERSVTQRLTAGDYEFADGELRQIRDVLPLHPNFRLLYETILQLAPRDVLELGCGGGDHLHNLRVLAPAMRLRGIDRDPKQLAYLRERHPDLDADVRVVDATLPLPATVEPADLVYTQAVIMHLHEGNSHRVALANLFRAARRHVVLMEHWGRHSYIDDINDLQARGVIDWPELNLYYRDSPELARPHILVASRDALDYPPLADFRVLRDPVT